MCLLKATEISKTFPNENSGKKELLVINKLSLEVYEGELITIFGPNGCGKSTILNLLAGIVQPDAGAIVWKNNDSQPLPIGYVFQNYTDTLLPWRSVRDNIAFPLEIRRLKKKELTEKVNRRIEQFKLTEHADKYTYQLSGGLKQLVTIARATVYDPRLLLLDEPFSSLDYSLSRMLWARFREFWTDLKITTVFVSHNVDEAIFLGDRIFVLSSPPTEIVEEITVPFGKNRNIDLLNTPDFFTIRSRVLKAFEHGNGI